MAVKAIAKGVRISPRKVAPVAALVRGRSVEDALTILDHTPRRSALAVKKVVMSAKANADHNHGYKPNTLQITEISVTAGPRLKRFRPVSRGMAHPFQHKTSHIRVVVDGDKREAKKPAAKKAETAKEEAK
ncbi:MAG TPA: 50S ribosomal protein L22 [Candidatus Saccharimonadales bacterium]|nr:50S ribosomal protein L22 [Candidatus Saccharimonadales bacterium]